MRFIFSNIVGALIRLAVVTAITVFLAAYQLSPQSVVEAVLNNPPAWATNPLVRLGVLFLGGALVVLLLNWERLFATRLDRDRRALVDRAFRALPLETREWLIQHYAGGRPTSPHAEILYQLRLVDRDFVGWTEVKPDLKPFIAEKVSHTNSVLRQWGRMLMAMTSMQWIVICLIASMTFGAIALVLIIRDGGSNRDIKTKEAASEALARLPSHATAPVERLAELGWTVTPQPDKLQFSITGPSLPDMTLSASLFNALDRPFTLQLQQLNSLAGLHLLSGNHQCTEIGIGAGEFTDTAELRDFTNLTKLVISQTPLNGKGVLDASSLGKLVNLRVLVLSSSRVKDVTFVSSLVNLETLNLGQTLVTDISAISGLSKLISFDVRGTRVTDLRPLRQSLALRELEIGGPQTRSLTNLTHLDGLKQLRVIEQGDVDLSAVGSLATLEGLFLWGPSNVDANVLRPLKALTSLQISGFGFQQVATTVVNAQAIAELKNLNTLTLGSLRLDTLDFLRGLKSLTALNLNELPLTSIEPVRTLQALKSISLTSIPVVDITPLVDLPALEEVRLMRTPARSDAVSALERRGVKVTVY